MMRAIHMTVFAVGLGWVCLQTAKAQQEADWASFQQGAACEMAPDCGSVDWCTGCSLWTATADAVLLHRTTAASNPLFVVSATGETALDAADLEFDFEPGVRLGLMRHALLGCWGLEVNYLGIDNWSSETAVDTQIVDAFTENFAGFDFGDIADYYARYDSRLYSGEVNLRRELGEPITFLAGFRMLELNEDLGISGTTSNGFFTDILHASTDNRLYGGQLGLDADLLCRGRLRVDGLLRAGVFYNRASQTSVDVNGTLVGPGFSLSDDRSAASFLGELGITGNYQLTSWLAFRTGYDLLWLAEVALAPHQTNNTDLGTGEISVDTGGDVLAHGGFIGLELVH